MGVRLSTVPVPNNAGLEPILFLDEEEIQILLRIHVYRIQNNQKGILESSNPRLMIHDNYIHI